MESKQCLKCLILGLSGILVALQSQASGPAAGELITRSPFGATASATNASPGETIEFRGVLAENSELFFSIHDAEKGTSRWVMLNAPDEHLVVRSYDASRQSIVVLSGGASRELFLKSAGLVAPQKPAGTIPKPDKPPTEGPVPILRKPATADSVPIVRTPITEGPIPIYGKPTIADPVPIVIKPTTGGPVSIPGSPTSGGPILILGKPTPVVPEPSDLEVGEPRF